MYGTGGTRRSAGGALGKHPIVVAEVRSGDTPRSARGRRLLGTAGSSPIGARQAGRASALSGIDAPRPVSSDEVV
jgi:hypothetical protein